MTAPTLDARTLVEAAQAGDRDAFGALYERYHDTVHRFIYYRTGNRHVAEDITADTFLRALARLDGFVWRQDIGAWLITIARNLITDRFKSGRYRLEVPTGDVAVGIHDHDADRRRDPHEVAEVNALSVALDAAIVRLTGDQRQVLALRFGAGLSVAETAAVMGRDVGAVKSLQSRACRALRRVLGGAR